MNIASLKAAKGAKGFTLVELIAVLVILGIIAAIAIPTYRTIIDNAQWRAVHSDADSFDRGLRLLAATYEDGSGNVDMTDPTNEDLVDLYLQEDFPTDKHPVLFGTDEVDYAVFSDASGDKLVAVDVDSDYSVPFASVRIDDENINRDNVTAQNVEDAFTAAAEPGEEDGE